MPFGVNFHRGLASPPFQTYARTLYKSSSGKSRALLQQQREKMSQRLLTVALAFAGALAAQDLPSRAGRFSYVSGAVSFQPAGVTDWVAATVNRPLTMGDRLYADSGARAEVHVPGAAFRLGDRTAFEFMNLDDATISACPRDTACRAQPKRPAAPSPPAHAQPQRQPPPERKPEQH